MSNVSGNDDGVQRGNLQATQAMDPQSAVELMKKSGPAAYGVVVGVLYVSGFLVLNGNLAKHGVLDVEFGNARYFLAAASFAFYMLCFYLFAGRAVLFGKRWLGEDLERIRKIGVSTKWFPVVALHSHLHALFFCCMSSAMFTSVAIGGVETTGFYSVLMLSFMILYPLDVANLDGRYPRTTEVIKIVTEAGAVYVFFAFGSAGVLRSVFFSYLVIFFFINQVLDVFDRYKVTKDRISFSALYAVVVLFGSAIAFGSLFYGQVSLKLGGARPQHVLIGLDESAHSALPVVVSGANTGILEGNLIHQTSSYTYVVAADQTIRLRSADVVTLVTSAKPEPNLADELKKLFKNGNEGEGGGTLLPPTDQPLTK